MVADLQRGAAARQPRPCIAPHVLAEAHARRRVHLYAVYFPGKLTEATRNGTPCRSPAMANGRCRMHGGSSPGAPIGNANARKHGRYSAQAIAERRQVAALIRAIRGLVEEIDGQD